jgi:uncharacterized membrane protein YfcA
MIEVILTYLGGGAVAGLCAGLFGIGGGVVIVPILFFCLTLQGISNNFIMHLALGTSMASITFTSVSSFWAHHRRGAVHWIMVRRISPGIPTGAFLGSCIASLLSTNILKGILIVCLYYVAVRMFMNREPKSAHGTPGQLAMFGVGNIIGAVSSLVGIGGGILSVPFMVWCNLSMYAAIGTAAAIGFPIAVAGSIGYIYNGLGVPGLPEFSLGYTYLPALAGIVAASVFTAPLGARWAHSLPVGKLKRVFALLLVLMGTRMLLSMFL